MIIGYDSILGSIDFGSDKRSKEASALSYKDDLLNTLASMFVYKGFENEKKFNSEFIEIYLLIFGECAIWRNEGDLIVTYCNRCGKPNANGLGVDLICTTQNGISKMFNNFEDSKEVVYVRNNTIIAPDLNIERYANMFAEIDKSTYNNVINSRYSPIILTRDENTTKMIKQALENNDSGKPQTVTSDNLMEDEKEMVLNITDVTASDKIQYLMKAHDDLYRRFYTTYGMNIMGSGKMAQLTRAEVNDGSESSMIIPYDRLNWRRKAIEKVNEYFSLDASVEFSIPWKLAFEEIVIYNAKENGEGEDEKHEIQNVDNENKDNIIDTIEEVTDNE